MSLGGSENPAGNPPENPTNITLKEGNSMSTSLTGIFLGAGASAEIGLPLVWDLTRELQDCLTPDMLRSLNLGWREQGLGYPDVVIDDMARTLAIPDMHYESILGYLETQYRRPSRFQQEYHALYSQLVELVYYILYFRHTKNVSYIERHLRYYEGIAHLAELNKPLWIFSLNHDVIIEALAIHCNIPVNCGFSNEIVTLPRRDKNGAKIGELKAETLSGEQLESGGMPFSQTRTLGINLLKIHGSLDVFTFRDGKNLLRLLPVEHSVAGLVEALRAANNELVYIDPAAPDHPAKRTNEIAYADDEGEMQFLRRTLLACAFKFDSRRRQVLPLRFLDHFRASINHVSVLICIGYGFGDAHINQVIREWLEFKADRKLEVVVPGTQHIPPFLLHLAPQVVLRASTATEYLDLVSGIVRSKRDGLEKRLSAYMRSNGIKAQTERQAEMQEFFEQQMDRLRAVCVEKVVALIHEGDIELNSLGMTPQELSHRWITESGGTSDAILEAFLKSKNA